MGKRLNLYKEDTKTSLYREWRKKGRVLRELRRRSLSKKSVVASRVRRCNLPRSFSHFVFCRNRCQLRINFLLGIFRKSIYILFFLPLFSLTYGTERYLGEKRAEQKKPTFQFQKNHNSLLP